MNWEIISATGEWAGALVVVATLFYLAMQVRQTRVDVARTSRLGVVEAHARWRAAVYEDLRIAELLDRDNKGESLTDAEQLQLKYLHFELFVSAALDSIMIDEGVPQAAHGYLLDVIRTNPSVRRQWDQQRPMMIDIVPEYVDAINKELDRDA